jgi:xanthine dehydrogenase YagS FAD-binding subunit
MREEVERPDRLVDINALPNNGIRADGSDLVIGALARMAMSPLIPTRCGYSR